ncbi:MAG: STAS/SEC14 domain-containing protein [Nitrospirales bacterium]|nr:MAG: STAS/SEC14 domain-containing protein [Nitrospirales bacterium]
MYHVLSESENGNLGIKIDGKLTRDDYELLIPYINRLRQEVGPLRLIWDMSECEGLNSQALWEDLTSQLHQFHEIPRVAVVGDRHWMECGTKVFHPLLKTTVKYFAPDQLENARMWVKGDET